MHDIHCTPKWPPSMCNRCETAWEHTSSMGCSVISPGNLRVAVVRGLSCRCRRCSLLLILGPSVLCLARMHVRHICMLRSGVLGILGLL